MKAKSLLSSLSKIDIEKILKTVEAGISIITMCKSVAPSNEEKRRKETIKGTVKTKKRHLKLLVISEELNLQHPIFKSEYLSIKNVEAIHRQIINDAKKYKGNNETYINDLYIDLENSSRDLQKIIILYNKKETEEKIYDSINVYLQHFLNKKGDEKNEKEY